MDRFNCKTFNSDLYFFGRWSMTPPTVNAYYSSIDNKIGKTWLSDDNR